jgi:predicted alpha/beta superfamily hydrolase
MAGSFELGPPGAAGALPGIETFTVTPPDLGVALRVSVARPVQPAIGGDDGGRSAVVYATDADYHFGTVVETARIASYGGDIAPAFVVGIGYADETGDLAFVSKRRFLDFYRGPRRSFDAGAYGSFEFGGADAFLAALRDTVIAGVERRYPAIDPARRVLLGSSAGGHFATCALAEDPALFAGFGLMSPMLIDPQNPGQEPPPGDGALVDLIDGVPETALSPALRVFLSAGALEEDPGTMFASFRIISNALRLRAALARRGVQTCYAQFADETHGSVSGAAISRALRFLLPPVAARPDWQAALDQSTPDA